MNTTVYGQLIFLCLLNITFILSGMILNTLVIITILKSTQLRKKLCYFMIMVLSVCDFITVFLGIITVSLRVTFWLTVNYNLLTTIETYDVFTDRTSGAISMFVLLVMSIERYLGVYYPLFHRTSVTRRRLLTLLGIFTTFPLILQTLFLHHKVFTYPVGSGVVILIYLAPFIFFNYKLFKISRKFRPRNVPSLEKKIKLSNLKNVSSCLLTIACLLFFSIPHFVYVVVALIEGLTSSYTRLSHIWVTTLFRMNCTFNCLIFFWKNKVLRIEGMRVLMAMKDHVFGTKRNI